MSPYNPNSTLYIHYICKAVSTLGMLVSYGFKRGINTYHLWLLILRLLYVSLLYHQLVRRSVKTIFVRFVTYFYESIVSSQTLLTCPFAPASFLALLAFLEKYSSRILGHSKRLDPVLLKPLNKTLYILLSFTLRPDLNVSSNICQTFLTRVTKLSADPTTGTELLLVLGLPGSDITLRPKLSPPANT